MFAKSSMKFLEQLMRSASPTGYESEAAKIFRDLPRAPHQDRLSGPLRQAGVLCRQRRRAGLIQ